MKLVILACFLVIGQFCLIHCGGGKRHRPGPGIVRFGRKGQYSVNTDKPPLGEGGFGVVYEGIDKTTGRRVAVKWESSDGRVPSLKRESKFYARVRNIRGIPKIYYAGEENGGFVIVMERLENSLKSLQKENGGTLSLRTVSKVLIELIYILEDVHNKGMVHRDIKPDNIGISGNQIYLFDFGLAKDFLKSNGEHCDEDNKILAKPTLGSGTPDFMSLYAHKNSAQSRRDDFESVVFLAMHFLTGSLPWKGLDKKRKSFKDGMMASKSQYDFEKFCKPFPPQIHEFFQHIMHLKFEQKPDYGYLRELLRKCLKYLGEPLDEWMDWHTIKFEDNV